MRFIKLIFIFFLYSSISNGQNRQDTIENLTKLSLTYLNAVFNEKNIDSAALLWSEGVFLDLKGGYMECNMSNQTRTDKETVQAFKKSLTDFKLLNAKVSFRIDYTYLIDIDDSTKFFHINSTIKNFNPQDTILRHIELDIGSKDIGKTWKIWRDHWAYYFVYYLCRRNKNYR